MSFFTSIVASFVRVIGSTVVGEHSAVLLGGEGVVGDVDDPLGDGASDSFTDSEAFGQPGVVWRPRPAEEIGGKMLGAEGLGLRLGNRTVPVGIRDLRLNRRFSAPKPGSVALVGYGGGFLAFDDTADQESMATLYVPYGFVGGVPTKAHTITVDPTGESISLLHGDGGQFVLLKNKELMAIADNGTWWKMKPGAFEVQADAINLIGTVSIGNPMLAVPLLAGSLSQPSTRLLITTP